MGRQIGRSTTYPDPDRGPAGEGEFLQIGLQVQLVVLGYHSRGQSPESFCLGHPEMGRRERGWYHDRIKNLDQNISVDIRLALQIPLVSDSLVNGLKYVLSVVTDIYVLWVLFRKYREVLTL